MSEKVIVRSREHLFGRTMWLKLLFSLGMYLFVWRSNTLELTDKRVVLRSGVFSKTERSIPLAKVQDVTVNRGPVGRMFGFGDIRIESAGGSSTEIEVWQYAKVERIKRELLRRSE